MPNSRARGLPCSISRARRRSSPAPPAASAAAIARALHKQGATVAISGRQAEKLEALAERARRARARAPLRPRRPRRRRQAHRRGDRQARTSRHPREQRRPHARQSLHGHEGRAVGRGDRRQPHLHLHAVPRRRPRHGARQVRLRPHHQHRVDLGRVRQSGAGQLRRLQGRHDRHDQVVGARGRRRAASPPTASRRASSPRP